MSNQAYLCMTGVRTIYPSMAENGYSPHEQTVATAFEVVPLLWLALFRASDLMTKTFEVDDELVAVTAPVTTTAEALDRLSRSVAHLEQLFPSLGTLANHQSMLRQHLEKLKREFVTIELEEIECLFEEGSDFQAKLKAALSFMGNANKGDGDVDAKQALLEITRVDPERPLVDPGMLWDDPDDYAREDFLNLGAVLGTAYHHGVPWE